MQAAGVATVLSDEQTKAIEFIESDLSRPLAAISGPAGSGKTTLIRELAKRLNGYMPVQIAAMTNKAAHVLRSKGMDAVSMHQACMRPVFKPPLDKLGTFLNQPIDDVELHYPSALVQRYGREKLYAALQTANSSSVYAALRELGINDVFAYIERWEPSAHKDGMLIIDEASMLGAKDLETCRRVFDNIVLVGDEYQLPPVKDSPIFWEVPDRFALVQIHRQAEGSMALKLATQLRTGSLSGLSVDTVAIDIERCRAGVPIIVWRNKTREKLTHEIRKRLGYENLGPQPGEFLICRNTGDRRARDRGLLNNSLWRVQTIPTGHSSAYILENDQGQTVRTTLHMEELQSGLGPPFRFAYALTAHNSQGSEWTDVMIHQPDCSAMFYSQDRSDAIRWLYTAITRSRNDVIWVENTING